MSAMVPESTLLVLLIGSFAAMSTAIPATPATGGDNYAATEAAKQAYAGYEVKADSGYSLLVSLTSETAQQDMA